MPIGFRVNASQFVGWDLASPLGPFTAVPSYANSGLTISTSWGDMVLYSQSLTEFDAFVTQVTGAADAGASADVEPVGAGSPACRPSSARDRRHARAGIALYSGCRWSR